MRACIAIAFILCVGGSVWAQVPPGYDAASFARSGAGARALGLGGAFFAVPENVTSAYWNPAGLAHLVGFQIEGMYTNWFGAGVYLQYLGVGGYPPLGESRPQLRLLDRPLTFAFNWLSTHIPDIPWSEDGVMGTFDAWSHLFIFSAALYWSDRLSVGVNAKIFHDRILEGWSFGLSWDFGILLTLSAGQAPLHIALITTDIGAPAIQWYGLPGGAPAHLPWLLKIGASARLLDEKVLLCAGLEWGVNVPRFERIRAGVEASVGPLALRLGWQQPLWGDSAITQTATGPWSLGLGISLFSWLALDYAFLPGRLGDSHLLALRMTM